MGRKRFVACLAIAASALFTMAGPAGAAERWGKVESIDLRFRKFSLVQEGTGKSYEIRIMPDTVLVLRDGRTTMGSVDLTRLQGHRVFATVEENPSHYAMKIWIRPDVPPEKDPINPGVGSVLP